MSIDSYWNKVMEQRASRRAVVAGGASLAGAAALLAACGGSGSSSSGSGAKGSGAKVFTDDKEEGPVKKGGVYKYYLASDLPSLDPFKQSSGAPVRNIGTFAMNRIVQFKQGPGVNPFNYDVAPDLAESWEVSNDGMTYTFKLRQGVKFQNIAPVNGRLFDSEDVTASYKRFSVGVAGIGTNPGSTGAPQYGGSFQGVVDTVSAPDKQTVVFKLKQPNSGFLGLLGNYQFFWVFPKEADVGYDPLTTVIGTGPFQVSNYIPSQSMEYKRNPDYYETGYPYLDGAMWYVIPEPAQQLAQFQAGAVHDYTPAQFDDFQALVTQNPALRIVSTGLGSAQGIGFARQDPNGPFIKDDRVRKALSLSLDRTTLLETLGDVDKYKALGIDRTYRITGWTEPAIDSWYVDPRGKDMGDTAQWFAYDVAKGKQLMSAAGYPNGFDTNSHYASDSGGILSQQFQPLLVQWASQVGIRAKQVGEIYNTQFNPHSWHGETDGLVNQAWTTYPDPGGELDYLFGPTSSRNQMGINDPQFNQMYAQQQQELDVNKRKSELLEIYKYLSNNMWHCPCSYSTIDQFVLYQPQVRNQVAYREIDGINTGQAYLHRWLAS